MLTSDPSAQFEELKTQLIEQIGKTFPIQDKHGRYEVRVRDLRVDDRLGTEDIRGQLAARLDGKAWAAPIIGTIDIADTSTGKVLVSRPGATLARIPKLTRHYSYLIGGQEKFISNQWRLRPGGYVKATEKPGEYEAQFQLAKGHHFDIQMDENGYMFMRIENRKIPMYSILQAAGISDEAIRSKWGAQNFEASKSKARVDKDLHSLYEVWRKEPPASGADLHGAVQEMLKETRLDPDIAKSNFGIHTESVTPELLLTASQKLIDVAAGRQPADPIDSLQYKELWTAKDQFVERISKSRKEITQRVQQALSKPSVQKKLQGGDDRVIRDVFMPDLLQKPLHGALVTSLAANGKQTNPISMLSDHSMVTLMGPGGIQNPHQISGSKSVTALDPSHLGFLDPVFTPESNAGVNTHMAVGVSVRNRKPHVRMFNTRTGKMEEVDAFQAAQSNIVLPDQVRWEAGKPVPLSTTPRMSDSRGQLRDDLGWKDAHYVLPSASQVFSAETNLVPFMQNDSAGRSTMSARHMGQAISVVGREAPKVQVEVGAGQTYENLLGSTFLSHKAPVTGVVDSVANDHIVIRGPGGQRHRVDLYHHYPTNDPKGQLHSEPLVKAGDKVKAGQVLADHNFSRNGTLAIGTNVRIAYLANGFNHEDGIVVSESAAKKLASEHLNKSDLFLTPNHRVGKREFLRDKPNAFEPARMEHIGEDGLVKPGTVVKPGDPLILALREDTRLVATGDRALAKIGKRLKSKFENSAVVWDSDYEGEVVRAERHGNNVVVHVKTREPLQVGSKISTRHSAKGIVTQILPDNEMPHDGAGKHVELLLNPASVAGRVNPGQILETAAGKIADKTGKPYVIKNFVGGVDYLKKVQADLAKHGLKDTETLYDPKTGRRLGDIMVGSQYVFQLEHQIDKKTIVRSTGPSFSSLEMPKLPYDPNTRIPRGGGSHGAQSLGALGLYAALASGLKDNLHEMQTLKSDQDQAHAVWEALTNGSLLPAPQVPFVFKKFEALLTGLGVNVHKEGANIRLMPMSDQEVLKLSRGEIKNPRKLIRGKDDKPERGGLFDPDVTGGEGGQHWGHIRLAEPMPNPTYSRAIAHTLGIQEASIPKIIEGKEKLPGGGYGGRGIKEALKALDLNKELAAAKKELEDPKVRGPALKKVHFKYKSLQALKDAGKTPDEAWTIQNVPVVPPVFRPIATMSDGTVKNHPLNSLYRRLGSTNEALKAGEKIPYNATLDTRAGLYQELQNLFGTTPKGKKALDIDMRGTREDRDKKLPGIIHMISGEQPKDGFFQDKLVGKKQDFTVRATISVDPNLSADEVGVPKKIAIEHFRPMVVNRLIRAGVPGDRAQLMVSRQDPVAMRALEAEIKERPVLMKRDPVLHQYGLVAQRVKLIDEPAIKISPLIMPPLGADVDGDTVALFLPLGPKAIQEAHKIMPSRRILSDSSGDVLFSPTNESALALYRMSIPRGALKHGFASQEDAEKAFLTNKIDLNEPIRVGSNKETTLGRLRIAKILPENYRQEFLTDSSKPFDRRYQNRVLSDIAKNKPKHFMELVDGMSQLGFQMAYESGHTVALKDLEPLRGVRDKLIRETKPVVEKLLAAGNTQAATSKWLETTKRIHDAYMDHYAKNPTNVSDMAVSGIKAKKEQFQGLVMAPMLVEDHRGQASRVPVTRSFAEGVDIGGYFLQAAGARRGLIQKTKSTAEPGYMSKLLVQANIDQPITAADCGTSQGIAMSIKNKDIVDRYLATPVTIDGRTLPAGTVVTPDILTRADKSRMDKLVVRSALKCRQPQGVCGKCMGVHPSGQHYQIGENVGIVAAQALGERATQLMLKQTHGAGIISTQEHIVSDFKEVQRLLDASQRSREDAAVAAKSGKVTAVSPTRQGSWNIYVGGSTKPLVSRQKPLEHIKPGYTFERGEVLTHGAPNIHDLLKSRGIEAVQAHMVDRLGKIYGREGVLQRHVELAVRNVTGVAMVTDPGDHQGYIRGDYVPKPVLDEINRTALKGKKSIQYQSELTATKMLPRYNQSDWMARLQGERIADNLRTGIQHAQRSTTRSHNPIPAIAQGTRVQ